MSRFLLRGSYGLSAPPAAGAPAYFIALTEKRWSRICTSAPYSWDSVKDNTGTISPPGTGINQVIGTWDGACVDQTRGLVVYPFAGGHTDWYGNGNYGLLLKDENPRYILLNERSPNAVMTDANPSGGTMRIDYSDGMPRTMHTWAVPAMMGGKAVMAYTSDYASLSSGNRPAAWWFDVDRAMTRVGGLPVPYSEVVANGGNGDGYYRYLGQHITTVPSSFEGSEAFYDPVNDQVVGIVKVPADSISPSQTAWTINPDGSYGPMFNVVSVGGNPVLQWLQVADMRADSKPSIVLGSSYNSTQIFWWNLTNRSGTRLEPISQTNSSAYNGASGWYPVWHKPSNAMLFYGSVMGGTTILKLKMNDPANPTTTTWTWSSITAAGGGDTPASGSVNLWSKFNIVNDMGNGQGALVVSTWENSGATYIYKLPVGALN